MFKDCIIKYQRSPDNPSNDKDCILIKYPTKDDGSYKTLIVPIVEDNTDYQNILQWVADGNTIEEAD